MLPESDGGEDDEEFLEKSNRFGADGSCHRYAAASDALFVGDDWKGDEMFAKTEEYMKAKGKEVVYFPRTKGVSSGLLSKIKSERNDADVR